jgi:cell division septation protein DedD
MKNKEFREIQVSSSALVFIFLGVLVLGVFIFLLGVSVGKKQALIAGPTTLIAQKTPETVAQPIVQKEPEPIDPSAAAAIKTEPQAGNQVKEEPPAKPPEKKPAANPPALERSKPAAQTAALTSDGKYYIQVGAFFEKSQATTQASKFKGQGYPTVVLDPLPTDKKTVYRVRLGGYASKDLAAQALARLNASAKKKTGYYITKG